MIEFIPLAFVIFIILTTVGLGIWTTRRSSTASDFFVASRSVGVGMNAGAISGEYLSAASFMGVAGLVMRYGYDTLWYPVCYAAGYLFLLLFIAGPLRRFGAYTIPDFAEGRFDSPLFRKIAVTFVLFIGFFYTMPQMKGAGVVMGEIMDWPYWVGIVVVGAVITFNVAIGGMKGITFVQAFQYWVKLFAISVPVFVLMSVFGWYGDRMNDNVKNPAAQPQFAEMKTLTMKGSAGAPANVLNSVGPAGFSIGGKPDFTVNAPSLLTPGVNGTTATLTINPTPGQLNAGSTPGLLNDIAVSAATIAQQNAIPADAQLFEVAADGSKPYATLQDALAAATDPAVDKKILVQPGKYTIANDIQVTVTVPRTHIVGVARDTVRISGSVPWTQAGDGGLIVIAAPDCSLRSLTLINAAEPTDPRPGHSVALKIGVAQGGPDAANFLAENCFLDSVTSAPGANGGGYDTVFVLPTGADATISNCHIRGASDVISNASVGLTVVDSTVECVNDVGGYPFWTGVNGNYPDPEMTVRNTAVIGASAPYGYVVFNGGGTVNLIGVCDKSAATPSYYFTATEGSGGALTLSNVCGQMPADRQDVAVTNLGDNTGEAGDAISATSRQIAAGEAIQLDHPVYVKVLEAHAGASAIPAKVTFNQPAPVTFDANSNVPNAPDNQRWLRPFGDFTSKQGYPLLYTYSLIMALVCGTAGLPHILVRFYTNPDGRAAKRTTFWVMVLIGVF